MTRQEKPIRKTDKKNRQDKFKKRTDLDILQWTEICIWNTGIIGFEEQREPHGALSESHVGSRYARYDGTWNTDKQESEIQGCQLQSMTYMNLVYKHR